MIGEFDLLFGCYFVFSEYLGKQKMIARFPRFVVLKTWFEKGDMLLRFFKLDNIDEELQKLRRK